MPGGDGRNRALQIIDGDNTDEEKYEALCDLEACCAGPISIDRIYHLVESMNSDLVETTLRLVASSVTTPIPAPLLTPSFLLRLAWIAASSKSRSIARESVDLLAAVLWQSTCLQDASEGAVSLADLLCEALSYHMHESHDDIVNACLHCLLRLLIASADGPEVAEVIMSRRDVIGALFDAIGCSEYDSECMPVLACSVLAQSLRLQRLLPDKFSEMLVDRQFDLMEALERIASQCSPNFVLPVIGALISLGCWTSTNRMKEVLAFINTVCFCLSSAIETSDELLQAWVVPICILLKPIIQARTRMVHSVPDDQQVVLERSIEFINEVLDRYPLYP